MKGDTFIIDYLKSCQMILKMFKLMPVQELAQNEHTQFHSSSDSNLSIEDINIAKKDELIFCSLLSFNRKYQNSIMRMI